MTAWIFDIDGVITNPQTKEITEPEILDHIIQKLEAGEPVALNTGRSLVEMVDRIINPLLQKVKNKKNLTNFFASGEKGGTWITFNESGQMQPHKDKSISVPESLWNKVKNLTDSEFLSSMFFDTTKETMISVEMKDGYEIEKYEKYQRILNVKIKKIISDENLNSQLKIDVVTISIDIENKSVGKNYAIRRIIEWLKNKKIVPQKYITFGDSFKSDIPMAQELNSHKLPVEFVYVGKESVDASEFPFPIKISQSKFEKGTLEFLKSL